MTTSELCRLVAVNASRAYDASMYGSSSPMAVGMFERMRTPRVGDLVLEISSGGFKAGRDAGRCLGRLLKIEMLPYPRDEEEPLDEPIRSRDVWTIERADGEGLAHWEDCRFIAVYETWYDAEIATR